MTRAELLAKADEYAAAKERSRELAALSNGRDAWEHNKDAEFSYFGEKTARNFAEMER